MRYLIYMSSAYKLLSDEELLDILTDSRKNNAAKNLTGMLLYGEGAFVQVLEGDAEAVDLTFKRIQLDYRHRNIITIISGEIEQRNFPEWSMGFKTVNADVLRQFEGFMDVRKNGLLIQDETHPAVIVLKTFAGANNMI
jgi:hypothetical protein